MNPEQGPAHNQYTIPSDQELELWWQVFEGYATGEQLLVSSSLSDLESGSSSLFDDLVHYRDESVIESDEKQVSIEQAILDFLVAYTFSDADLDPALIRFAFNITPNIKRDLLHSLPHRKRDMKNYLGRPPSRIEHSYYARRARVAKKAISCRLFSEI